VVTAKRIIGLSFSLLLVGCGSNPPATFKGVLWLSWTIQGQSVSDAVCANIDHIVITVESTPSVGVEIEPIACSHGVDWERDDVPEGSDTVLIDAVDPAGQTTFETSAKIGVTESRPSTPTVVDLDTLF
jgi:hypothetical protein